MRVNASVLFTAIILICPAPASSGVPMPNAPQEASVVAPVTGALGENVIYDSDPTWDWRAQKYSVNFSAASGLHEVDSPFWVGLAGLEDLDYEPDDGWELMARDFGSATTVRPTPFFILYNKYRGTARFIAYISSALKGNYSYGRVTLSFSPGSPTTKNLTNRSILHPLSKWTAAEPAELTSLIRLQEGWNYADFQIAYDPDVDQVVEPIFLFEIDAVNDYTLTLDGVSISEQRSQAVTDLNRSGLDVATSILTGLQKARKNYVSAQKYGEDALVYASKTLFPNHAETWLGIAGLVLPSPSIALIPTIAGAVGFAESLLGLRKKDNTPKIVRTESHLALRGAMHMEASIASFEVRVPGANHNNRPNLLPIWDHPLGVFAIVNAPACTYSTSAGPYNEVYTPCFTCALVPYQDWFAWMDVLNITTPVQYTLNTSFPGALTLRSIEGAWSFQAPQLLQGASEGRWSQLPSNYLNAMNQAVSDGRYVLIGSADVLGTKYYQYRTQFVSLDQFHYYKPEIPRTWVSGEPYYSQQSDVTPPVQIRARFMKPGGQVNDDVVIVDSYDLFWPNSSPLTSGGPFTAVEPVWKLPVAPQQEISNLPEGAVIQQNQPWDIRWEPLAGDITSIKVGWTCSTGVFDQCWLFGGGREDIYTGIENKGIASASLHGNGTNRAFLTTCNGPNCYTSTRTINFTLVDLSTITGAVDPAVCPSGASQAVVRLHASWTTLSPTDAPDAIDVWTPSGQHLSASVALAAATTSHSIAIDVPCEIGDLRYKVSSGLLAMVFGEQRSTTNERTIAINVCGNCGDGGGGDPGGGGDGDPDPILHAILLRSSNPVRTGDALVFDLRLPRPTSVELWLFDVAGKRVAHLPAREFGGGFQSIRWTPKPSRPGAYFLRVDLNGEQSISRRLIMIQ